jgi:hypothetical protein
VTAAADRSAALLRQLDENRQKRDDLRHAPHCSGGPLVTSKGYSVTTDHVPDVQGRSERQAWRLMTSDLAADDATRALSDALLILLHDARPPCADGSNAWTDEDHEVRAKVAPHCDDCPIRPPCADFADTARPRITFGIDYTATTRKAMTS